MTAKLNRSSLSWALYDWGNSAFATTVLSAFFPVLFKHYWNQGVDSTEVTFRLGLANSMAAAVVVVAALCLGVLSDVVGMKKRFLFCFASLGIIAIALLPWVGPGNWMAAAGLFILGRIGFAGGNIFYDSLLMSVASSKDRDRVSALGYSLGYLGGGVLFAFNILMTQKPELFGFSDGTQAARISMMTVSLWWGLFSIPMLLWVKEPSVKQKIHLIPAIKEGSQRLLKTLRDIRKIKPIWMFLLAYFFYIDGVHTIIQMATDYGLSLGFPESSLMIALLIVQFVGFPAALAFGKLGEKIGAKRAILIGIAAYSGVSIWGYFITSVTEFYILAVGVALVIGGVQSLSRSLYSRMIPPDRAGEFFGFYNMFGKFAAVVGPLLMAFVARWTGSPRLSILSVIILFIAGGGVLLKVEEPKPGSAR